jgi:hypothetical protein
MLEVELIINDFSYYISKSILEFKYFEKAYDHDKRIIFPKLLYEQICYYIEINIQKNTLN